MSGVQKFVCELEINASAHKFYKIFKDQVSHIPNICSKIIKKVKVHEGDWDSHGHGSIKIWNYTLDGKDEVFKERVEFDDKKLMVSLIGLEGDVFKHYKTYNAIFQVVPKGPKHSVGIVTLEFERLNGDSPYPYKYFDLVINLTKDIESHIKE